MNMSTYTKRESNPWATVSTAKLEDRSLLPCPADETISKIAAISQGVDSHQASQTP